MEPTKAKEEAVTDKTMPKAAPDLAEIMAYRGRGMSLSEIGRLTGRSKQAVSALCKRHGLDPGEVQRFRKDRGAILAVKQKLLLDGITPESVKQMAPRDRTVSFGILFDKERLETGQSTVNLAAQFTKIDLSIVQTPEPGGDLQ